MPRAGVVCHVLVCTNRRDANSPLPSCAGNGSEAVYAAFVREASRRTGVKITPTGCLTPCQYGPTIVIYPEGIWYAQITPQDAAEILAAHSDNNESVPRLLLPGDARVI